MRTTLEGPTVVKQDLDRNVCCRRYTATLMHLKYVQQKYAGVHGVLSKC